MRSVLLSGISRIASVIPTAIAVIVLSRVIIGEFGIGTFNEYSLIFALILLLPVNSLGVGATVTDRYAALGADAAETRAALLSAIRVLLVSAAATSLAAIVVTIGGWWEPLLGDAAPLDKFCLLAMLLFAVSFVPGLAVSVLLGEQRNHIVVLIQTLTYPVALLMVGVMIWLDLPDGLVTVVPPASTLAIGLMLAFAARRFVPDGWAGLLRQAPYRSRFPGGKIWALSGPVLISQLATPVALQLDRFVLSHVSTAGELATYSVVVPIWAPSVGIIAALCQPLWPLWAKARAENTPGPSLPLVLLVMTGISGLMAVCLAVLSPLVADLVAQDQIHVGSDMLIASSLCLVVTGLSYPMTMRLMYPSGARLVATLMVISLPVNVVLSIFLAEQMGAAGPLYATAATGFLIGTVPAIVYDRIHERRTVRTEPELTTV